MALVTNVMSLLCASVSPWKEEGQSGLDRVLCELGRAGQEQGPFDFLLKLPTRTSFHLPPWVRGHGGVKKNAVGISHRWENQKKILPPVRAQLC